MGPRAHAELGHDVVKVALNGSLGEKEPGGDDLAGHPCALDPCPGLFQAPQLHLDLAQGAHGHREVGGGAHGLEASDRGPQVAARRLGVAQLALRHVTHALRAVRDHEGILGGLDDRQEFVLGDRPFAGPIRHARKAHPEPGSQGPYVGRGRPGQ